MRNFTRMQLFYIFTNVIFISLSFHYSGGCIVYHIYKKKESLSLPFFCLLPSPLNPAGVSECDYLVYRLYLNPWMYSVAFAVK